MRTRGALAAVAALLLALPAAAPVPASAAPLPGSSCNLFPSDNVWNTDISQLPVNSHSTAWLTSSAPGSGLLHPDFGAPPYGIPFNVVDNSYPTRTFQFDYASESDPGPYPFGSGILIENGSDAHALIVNKDTCKLYEIYNADRNDGTAGSGAIWDLGSNALRPDSWTSADAAGLPILPGLVRYDEVQAGAINHAIRFTVQQTDRSHLWPARHDASSLSNPNLPPMGARFRLKAGFDISGYSPQAQVVLTAMKHYGLIVADNGSNWYFQGTEDSRWTNSLLDELKQIPQNQFEAVDESSLMIDPNSGQAAQPCSPNPASASPSTPPSPTTFYFAEGFTGTGFSECLSLFTPNVSGTAVLDYYTQSGHLPTQYVALNAGQVSRIDVGSVVGAGEQVSVRVQLPGPGVVERRLSFDFANWHGSTELVGTPTARSDWEFAEGSTLPFFSEYLTLQNPNATSVSADLDYFTDTAGHPSRQLVLPPTSRTTVEVLSGSSAAGPIVGCVPNGPAASCGVGPGIQGVAVSVHAEGGQGIIVERPFYVNGLGFGAGAPPIHDGHDAFGVGGPASTWYFAEGTSVSGFTEYLTLQNPNPVTAQVTVSLISAAGGTPVTYVRQVPPMSRDTSIPAQSVGSPPLDFSLEVDSTQPVVAERPIYEAHDFGTGLVAGATDVVGATGLATTFGFADASTAPGQYDFLTLENPGSAGATVTVEYYTGSAVITRSIAVGAHTRHTVQVFDSVEGAGPGQTAMGIVVTSDQGILVEKPTYSTGGAYGATDTAGYVPPGGF